MKNIFTSLLFFATAALFAQAVPKATPMPAKAFSEKSIVIVDPARENPVLALYGNKRWFVKNVKVVIDTLSANNTYRVLTVHDSIKRYSDSKFVRQVILVSRKPKN